MSNSAQRKAVEPDAAALAAAASAREAQRARRRRRQRAAMNDQHRGYRYEFVDGEPETAGDVDFAELPAGSVHPSDRGAGPLGFAGTVHKEAVEAAGLATLAGDDFGAGPKLPMVPGTWELEGNFSGRAAD